MNAPVLDLIASLADFEWEGHDRLGRFGKRVQQVVGAPIAMVWRADLGPGSIFLEHSWGLTPVEALAFGKLLPILGSSPERCESDGLHLVTCPLRIQKRLLGAILLGWRANPPVGEDQLIALRAPVKAVAYAMALDFSIKEADVRRRDLEESIRALEVANEELRQLDRMKSDFLSNVSHELRTPLNLILGFGSLMQDGVGGPLGKEHQEYVEKILAATERLRILVTNILDLAKLESGEMRLHCTWIDLTGILRQIVAEFEGSEMALGKRLEVVATEGLPPVWASPEYVYQILQNLIANALKFSSAGGRVSIRCTLRDNTLLTEVEDNGIGIPEQHQAHVFERFFQVDGTSTRAYGGTGLGLAIVRQLVEVHGGEVGLQSTPGAGSTFWFTLPTQPPVS